MIVGVNMLAEELSANRMQLEDRVRERTAELEAARLELTRQIGILEQQGSALESAVRAKGDFVALVSHELRTPLTSLIGYLQLLDDVAEPIPEEASHYVAVASRNADRLLLLITDLLAASEFENTPMRLSLAPTDLSALANQSIEDLSQRAGLTFVRELPPGTAAIPGLGLGLMITNTVIEAHHGTLSFSSREHEGTSVQVHLPMDPRSRSTVTSCAAVFGP